MPLFRVVARTLQLSGQPSPVAITAMRTSTGRPPRILLAPLTGGPKDNLMAALKSWPDSEDDAARYWRESRHDA
jgi:hypothetical protein